MQTLKELQKKARKRSRKMDQKMKTCFWTDKKHDKLMNAIQQHPDFDEYIKISNAYFDSM